MNKTTQASRATRNISNSKFNDDIPQWSEESNSEEEYIGMRKDRIKRDVENTNKEVKGQSIEEEDITIPKCIRKSHVENVNEETK